MNTKAGVRIHHPTLRNCIFTIMQPARPYPVPFDCPMCGTIHQYKTFHLNLNEHGDVCVTPEIYQLFKDEGILMDMQAKKDVVPAPTRIHLPGEHLDEEVYQPDVVISAESGIVVAPGIAARRVTNAVEPPAGRFRREADGTWTDLDKEE